jgi:hypothetical protein
MLRFDDMGIRVDDGKMVWHLRPPL